MDIQIQLLEKFTLRVQPFFTVGQLKDLIAEKIDLEHPDVHLLFNDALLEENWLTLSSVGLVPGSLVTALSKDLARYKAGQSQVRSVEEAFTTIADERLVGAKAEADALERSTPFSIFCSRFALIELGPGWPLFFDFVIFLGVLLFLVVLIQIAVFVEFGASYNIGLWPLGENEPIGQWMTSAGNYGPDGSSSCTTGDARNPSRVPPCRVQQLTCTDLFVRVQFLMCGYCHATPRLPRNHAVMLTRRECGGGKRNRVHDLLGKCHERRI